MTDDSMVRIPAGTFRMGSDEFYPDEQPVHDRVVEEFRIDRFAVTNEQFAEFVADTRYVTTAEQSLDPAQYPGVAPEDLAPGSLVFTPTSGPVDLSDWRQWWRWEPGASWRHPFGPESSLEGRSRHPVVHVSFADAAAYAAWAGKRLPTEAEHEYAARGGADGERFAWGSEPFPGGIAHANSWVGRFPYDNRGRFGADTAPAGSYPPNGYGVYDLIGNTWEWTTDYYAPRHIVPGAPRVDAEGRADLLRTASPEPGSTIPRRVLKGGSYLCSPEYCLRFRPAARSPQAEDSATTHIGFRCVVSA